MDVAPIGFMFSFSGVTLGGFGSITFYLIAAILTAAIGATGLHPGPTSGLDPVRNVLGGVDEAVRPDPGFGQQAPTPGSARHSRLPATDRRSRIRVSGRRTTDSRVLGSSRYRVTGRSHTPPQGLVVTTEHKGAPGHSGRGAFFAARCQ